MFGTVKIGDDDPNFAADWAKATAHMRAAQKELITAINKHDAVSQKEAIGYLLSAPEPRIHCAAVIGLSKKFRGDPSAKLIKRIANGFDLTTPINEKVIIFGRDKGGGKVRAILVFGNWHRTAQAVLRIILSCYYVPKGFQAAGRCGSAASDAKGIQGTLKAVKKEIEAGKLYFCHMDIKKFFPSFRIEKLGEEGALGNKLPMKTLHAFCTARGLHMSGDYTLPSSVRKEARRGIPTGSSLSPLIADMMVSRMPLPVSAYQDVFNYADNFMLLAKTKSELLEIKAQLMTAVEHIPGGCFSLRREAEGCFEQSSVDFLGHNISFHDGKVHFRVMQENEEALYDRLSGFLYNGAEHDDPKLKVSMLARFRRSYSYILSWSQAFALCENSVELRDLAFVILEAHLTAGGYTVNDLSKELADDFCAADHFDFSKLNMPNPK